MSMDSHLLVAQLYIYLVDDAIYVIAMFRSE